MGPVRPSEIRGRVSDWVTIAKPWCALAHSLPLEYFFKIRKNKNPSETGKPARCPGLPAFHTHGALRGVAGSAPMADGSEAPSTADLRRRPQGARK